MEGKNHNFDEVLSAYFTFQKELKVIYYPVEKRLVDQLHFLLARFLNSKLVYKLDCHILPVQLSSNDLKQPASKTIQARS